MFHDSINNDIFFYQDLSQSRHFCVLVNSSKEWHHRGNILADLNFSGTVNLYLYGLKVTACGIPYTVLYSICMKNKTAVLEKRCEFCLIIELLFLIWFLDGERKEEDKQTAQSGSLNLAKPVLIWCHAVLSFVDEKSHDFTNTNSEIKVTQRSFTYIETIIETLQI